MGLPAVIQDEPLQQPGSPAEGLVTLSPRMPKPSRDRVRHALARLRDGLEALY
jgi:hypothetical protein